MNKIARRKQGDSSDDEVVTSALRTTKPVRSRNDDREKTLEADSTGSGAFSGLSKSSTVIHIPPGTKKSDWVSGTTSGTTKTEKEAKEEQEKADLAMAMALSADLNGPSARTTERHHNGNGNADRNDVAGYLARYKARNERDTSNRYKDTSDLIESLKAPAKSNYNHYGHYDNPGVEASSVSSYYKPRYEQPEVEKPSLASSASSAAALSSSAASRRTKSYRTRKEASKERKHLTMKLSAVNMDIDSPPPTTTAVAPATTTSSRKPDGTSASGRSYKQYGAARKSQGTGLTNGNGYQRSQTQKLLYDFDDNDTYHPPTPRDNKRKEIQNVIRKYAAYDDEDLRRTTTNPYSTNPMKSATSANLAYGNSGGGSGASSHLYGSGSGRRDPIAEHYGLGSAGSGYPRSHHAYAGYDYPSPYAGASASALAKANPYLSSASGLGSRADMNPYNPLSKTHSTAAFNNSSYLGGYGGSSAAAAQRSRKNLMSFVRKRGECV